MNYISQQTYYSPIKLLIPNYNFQNNKKIQDHHLEILHLQRSSRSKERIIISLAPLPNTITLIFIKLDRIS